MEGGQGRHINQGLGMKQASHIYVSLSIFDAVASCTIRLMQGKNLNIQLSMGKGGGAFRHSEYVQSDGCSVESWQPASRAQARIRVIMSIV